MNTSIYLNPTTGDWMVDLNGNIAVCTSPYSQAQDAACQIKLWLGELYYDTTQGVDWQSILGESPPATYVREQLEAAAELVPGVVQATVVFSSFAQRNIHGQVTITNTAGQTATASF